MNFSKPHTVHPFIIYTFFVVGLISAIAFRAIIILQHFEPAWVRPVWYLAVMGYLLFFLYRYKISQKRKKAIRDYQLIEKIQANACLQDEDREVLTYLLSSIKVSLEDRNYAIIFITSILAIAADLLLYYLK